MDSESDLLHLLFFPLMAHGHMLPMVDMAKLFAARGVRTSILTTPANAPLIQPSIDRANESGHPPIQIVLVPFPSTDHGLPKGCENVSSIPTQDFRSNFLEAVLELRQPFDQVLRHILPDCVVTDTFLPWTYEVAAKLNIPRLVFHGMNFFALCTRGIVETQKPHENVAPEDESFVIPGIPHRIEMLKSHMRKFANIPPVLVEIFKQSQDFEPKSYGVVMNSFYELEPDYVDHYRNVVGRRAWHLGPVSLCNQNIADESVRGNKSSMDQNVCLKWLDSKSPGSVVYVCFGSISDFTKVQLHEIALGLEASSYPFIWVVRDGGNEWIPQGFEERIERRGLIIRGWAPQILILNHRSVGGFVTHCGWNSSLEGISAGLPLVTWPLFAEQFYNERLIVDVLKIGVPIGVKVHSSKPDERELVDAGKIEIAVNLLMHGGDDASERRRKAREIGQMARKAVEKGGSSYNDLSQLIQELMDRRSAAKPAIE